MSVDLSKAVNKGLVRPKDLGAAAYSSMSDSNRIEGYAGNGDYIELPITATGDIDYFNAAGVSQSGWPISIANVSSAVSGSVTKWYGPGFYGTDLMMACLDASPGPDTVSIVTIDSAGAITQIGSTVAWGTDFPTPNGGWSDASSVGSSNIYRLSDTGNVFIVQREADSLYEGEINATTGAEVTQPTKIIDFSDGFAPAYKTANGLYIGSLDYSTSFESAEYHFGVKNAESAAMTIPATQLPGTSNPTVIVQTKGYRTLVTPNSSTAGSLARHFDALELDTGMEALAKMGGVTP